MDWIRTKDLRPPEDVIIETKIDDGQSTRNEGTLIFHRGLFFQTDLSMYVYYTPTHWKNVEN